MNITSISMYLWMYKKNGHGVCVLFMRLWHVKRELTLHWPLAFTHTLSLSLSFHLSLCLLLPLTLFCHSLQWFLKEAPDVDISHLLCEQIGSGFKRILSPPFQFTLPDRCSSPPSLSLSLSLSFVTRAHILHSVMSVTWNFLIPDLITSHDN